MGMEDGMYKRCAKDNKVCVKNDGKRKTKNKKYMLTLLLKVA